MGTMFAPGPRCLGSRRGVSLALRLWFRFFLFLDMGLGVVVRLHGIDPAHAADEQRAEALLIDEVDMAIATLAGLDAAGDLATLQSCLDPVAAQVVLAAGVHERQLNGLAGLGGGDVRVLLAAARHTAL